MLPWHSMAAARCQVLLTLAQRRQLGCVFDPSSRKNLFLPSQAPGRSMCALVLRGVCKSWTSANHPLTLGFMMSARSASSCFTRPMFELGLSSRAPQVSAHEFDGHAPSCRGSFRPCITMYSNVGLSTPHTSSSPFAVVHGLLSCRLAAVPDLS